MADRLRKSHRFSTVPEHLIRDKTLTDRAFRLWCILDRYAGADGAAFPSRKRLAEDLSGCSLASVDRALALLVQGGWLHKERRAAGGSNDYTLLIAKVPNLAGERSRRRRPSVTGEATPLASQVAPPVVTGDDTLDSPVTPPVVTGDAHKEESPKEAPPKEAPSKEAAPPRRRPTTGTRLPDDWEPSEHLREWFREARLDAEDPDSPLLSTLVRPWPETQNFKDYWLTRTGKDATKLDWDRTWQRWIRSSAQRAAERQGWKRKPDNLHHAPESEGSAARRAAFEGRKAN